MLAKTERATAAETTTPESSNKREALADEEDVAVDDGYFADVGFMFEGSQPTRVEIFEWTTNRNRKLSVQLRIVDDEPGAVQSGHYLWPASKILANHLVKNPTYPEPTNVVELGAGCALLSCMALQLWQPSLECVVVTDHDPGTLERARDNYESTLQAILDRSVSEEELNEAINESASINFVFESLEWGSEVDIKKVRTTLGEHHRAHQRRADLILGSDLIHDSTVAWPLLQTAKALLATDGVFLLSQSFAYDTETEAKLGESCQALGLVRKVVLEKDEGKTRIQEFRLLEPSSSSFDEHDVDPEVKPKEQN